MAIIHLSHAFYRAWVLLFCGFVCCCRSYV